VRAVLGRRWRLSLAIAGVVVIVLGVGGWAVFLRPSSAASSEVTYRTTTVATGTLKQSVSATGTIAAATTEDLSFPASGEVTAVYVTAGQKVAKGQRLAAIDSAR
jgi:macrolide-specific efflux system membrane fusion protein